MRILPISALALAVTMSVTGAGVAEPPDLETLSECSDRAWAEGIAAWADYAFDRHVTRRSLDIKGKETFRQEMRFRLTPKGGAFDERLVEIDGRQPTAKEVAEHRDKARFSKHYQQAEELELDNPLGENLALLPLLREQDYRITGEGEVDGVPCTRVEFDARSETGRGSVREQMLRAVKGSGCFSADGCHLLVFDMETVRPLKESPLKLERLHLSFAGQPVEHGWLLKAVEVESDFSVWGKKFRKLNFYGYSNFRHLP